MSYQIKQGVVYSRKHVLNLKYGRPPKGRGRVRQLSKTKALRSIRTLTRNRPAPPGWPWRVQHVEGRAGSGRNGSSFVEQDPRPSRTADRPGSGWMGTSKSPARLKVWREGLLTKSLHILECLHVDRANQSVTAFEFSSILSEGGVTPIVFVLRVSKYQWPLLEKQPPIAPRTDRSSAAANYRMSVLRRVNWEHSMTFDVQS